MNALTFALCCQLENNFASLFFIIARPPLQAATDHREGALAPASRRRRSAAGAQARTARPERGPDAPGARPLDSADGTPQAER